MRRYPHTSYRGPQHGVRHRAEVERILTKQFADLHKMALTEIKVYITAIIDHMTPSVANHAYGAVKTFLTWCRRRQLIPSNPLEDMKVPYKTQSRDRILADDELCRIWHACPQLGTFGRIVQTLILTGCRRSEIANSKAGVGTGRPARHSERAHEGEARAHHPVAAFTHSFTASLPTRSPFVFSARDKPETPFSGWSKREVAPQFRTIR